MDKLKQIAEHLSNPNRTIRYRAIYALSKLDGPEAADLLASVLRDDSDYDIRALAAKLLNKFPAKLSAPHLIVALQQDRAATVRRAATEALGVCAWPTPEIETALTEALYDRSKHVRRAAVQSLRVLESTDAVPGLVGVLLGDEDSYVRWEAAKTLEALAPLSAISALIECLAADENSYVRQAAAVALGKYHDMDRTTEPLTVALLHDENSAVRCAAGQSLGALLQDVVDVSLVRAMLYALNDPDTLVWHVAAENLWGVGDTAYPVILDALVSEEPGLRRVALKALLWLSAEFDEDFAPGDELADASVWGWWN